MSTYEDLLEAIHGGQSLKLHSATWSERASQYGTTFAYTVVLGYVIYIFSHFVGLPITSAPQLLWHGVLVFVPSRLVLLLGTPSELASDSGEAANSAKMAVSLSPRQKSEVLRKVFGLDAQGLLKNAPGDRIRRLSLLLKGTPGEAPPGLGNWDNSCYQNSVIQGLASLHTFRDFLSRSTSEYHTIPRESTNSALFEIIKKLNDPNHAGQRLWTPPKLKSMSSWQQQDAQEYFSKVLDEMEREIVSASKRRTDNQGLAQVPQALRDQHQAEKSPKSTSTPATGETTRPSESNPSQPVLRNPIEGLLAQRVGCIHCGYSEGLSMIPFNCLTVPLGRSWGYDVTECLDEYTNLEQIEGVTCAKCTLLRTEANIKRVMESSSLNSSTTESRRNPLAARLQRVQEAIEEDDYSDNTIVKDCEVPKKNWVSSTKSRQAVVARTPKALVIHVNRSMFDEYTGAQLKNYASISFPKHLDLSPWCLGGPTNAEGIPETWAMNPNQSMISQDATGAPNAQYELRSVVTHYGRHENGHYINYRPDPFKLTDAPSKSANGEMPGLEDTEAPVQQWWCLSDEDVSRVSEENVLQQGGVFMLFYEQVQPHDLSVGAAAPEAPVAATDTTTTPEGLLSSTIINSSTRTTSRTATPVEITPTSSQSEIPESVASVSSTQEDSPQFSDTSSQADTEASDDTAQTEVDPTLGKDSKETSQSGGMRMRTAPPSSSVGGDDPMSHIRMVAAT